VALDALSVCFKVTIISLRLIFSKDCFTSQQFHINILENEYIILRNTF